MPTKFLLRSCAVGALGLAVGCGAERPEEAPEPPRIVSTESGLAFTDGCWSLEYGPSTAGLPTTDAPALPPEELRIWTDSTFPNADGFLQVAPAPGYEGSGGGMLTQISSRPDSIELTWTARNVSTHLRLGVTERAMQGTAWHHGESGSAASAPREVQLRPIPCSTATMGTANG